MRKPLLPLMLACGVALVTTSASASNTTDSSNSAPASLQAVPFTDVQVKDAFWAPRIRVNREKVLPHNFRYCEDTGRISNFAKAAGLMEGPFEGIYYNDSDVYKVIEGAAYSLAHQRDPALEKTVDEVIAKIAAAQQEDGYLYTYYTVRDEQEKRYSNVRRMHELYCAGHLIEAAVAYHQATGKRTLLDVAIRLADHIDSVFGPDGKTDPPGHEEIELALVKLWRHTGQERYLDLARFFVEQRGRTEGRDGYGDYSQDHLPVRDQREIAGHAVRAMYLYAAVADLAAVDGDRDYLRTMDAIWRDVVHRKMYVTGGIGPSGHNEGFTVAYDLPNDSAYAETCAAVGMVLWNHRLNLLHADARYADVVERAMYNGLLSGVSLDGSNYFYVNPLGSRGNRHRQPWFGTSCCPTNIVRFLPTVGGYAYAHGPGALYVNHYIAGSGRVPVDGRTVRITQETRYPWDGDVALRVEPDRARAFTLSLRIPGWSQGAEGPDDLYRMEGKPVKGAVSLSVNGKPVPAWSIRKGYAELKRTWKPGDVVRIQMPMPVRRVRAHPSVEADRGRVALQRGPIVYCLEGVDNANNVRHLALPEDSSLSARFEKDQLGGVSVVTGTALARTAGDGRPERVAFTAVPYYAWDNRDAGPMVVWLPEDPADAEPRPVPTIAHRSRASSSHVHRVDSRMALNDQLEPKSSSDLEVPRFTWWDHKGTAEWVQYDLPEPATVSGVQVYWFDDTPTRGDCRPPAAWQVLYRDGETWKPVSGASGYGTATDAFNTVRFDAVKTDGLRLAVTLRPEFSAGILEWRVIP